jgi:hypothetical protein
MLVDHTRAVKALSSDYASAVRLQNSIKVSKEHLAAQEKKLSELVTGFSDIKPGVPEWTKNGMSCWTRYTVSKANGAVDTVMAWGYFVAQNGQVSITKRKFTANRLTGDFEMLSSIVISAETPRTVVKSLLRLDSWMYGEEVFKRQAIGIVNKMYIELMKRSFE